MNTCINCGECIDTGCLCTVAWPEIDPLYAKPAVRDEFDDDDQPWADLDRATSVLIWIIVTLCALLLAYLGFLAWQQFT